MCAAVAVECGYIDEDVVSSPPLGTMTLPSRSNNGYAIDRRPIDSRFDFDLRRFRRVFVDPDRLAEISFAERNDPR